MYELPRRSGDAHLYRLNHPLGEASITQAKARALPIAFEAEVTKLDGWADDQVAASEKALKDMKKRIRELRNESGKAADLAEQARLQGEIAEAERRQRKLRQGIFEIEDRIMAARDRLVAGIRGKLAPNLKKQSLFTIRWSLHGQSGKHSPSANYSLGFRHAGN